MRTFVVRIWVPGTGEPPPTGVLRGTVHDVRTGGGRAFASGEELLAILSGTLGGPQEGHEREPATP